MDFLDLKDTTKEIEVKALPEAADLANGVLTNAASLFSGILNNTAILSANLLQGVEAERTEAMNGLNAALAPLIAESVAWRAQVERLCGILERVSLKP